MFLFLAPGLFQQTTSGVHVVDGCPGVLPPSFSLNPAPEPGILNPEAQAVNSKSYHKALLALDPAQVLCPLSRSGPTWLQAA